jgi:type III pantothenate kinase
MTPSLLLLDAGNTRIKWARVRDARWEELGVSGYDDLGELIQAAKVTGPGGQCWIASVAGAARNRLIKQSLREAEVSLHWIESQAEQCGVVSHYKAPQQLGVDRWMALLAARNRSQDACLIVSAGTAMTVDALAADGQFLGGIIVPGIGLMQQALQQGTALVGQTEGTDPDLSGQYRRCSSHRRGAGHGGCDQPDARAPVCPDRGMAALLANGR